MSHLEEKAIFSMKLDKKGNIISPGGSIVYLPKVMKLLKENSTMIFLHQPFSRLIKVMGDPNTRGIANSGHKTIKEIYDERVPLYKKHADIIFDLSYLDLSKNPEDNLKIVIKDLLEIIKNHTFRK